MVCGVNCNCGGNCRCGKAAEYDFSQKSAESNNSRLMFSDLTGAKLKKMLGANKASRRYHNKNNSGGNFGINIYTDGKDSFEINGKYNTKGEITSMGIGKLWGMPTQYRIGNTDKTQLLKFIKEKYNQVISGDIHAAEFSQKSESFSADEGCESCGEPFEGHIKMCENCNECEDCCEYHGQTCSNPACEMEECEDDVYWHEGDKPYCYNCGLVFKKAKYSAESYDCLDCKDKGSKAYGKRCGHCIHLDYPTQNEILSGSWKNAEYNQLNLYRNLGIGAALVTGLAYWINRK